MSGRKGIVLTGAIVGMLAVALVKFETQSTWVFVSYAS